ncbi:MAG: amidohydrolase family protein [Pseudomonadota bacterium]
MLKTPISADSHIVEPPHCYVDFIDPKYRDAAPTLGKTKDGVDAFIADGLTQKIPLGLLAAAGVPPDELKAHREYNFSQLDPASWDPRYRVAAQERDGVGGEIIFASVGMVLCSHPDYRYKRACFQAYNRWLQTFCGEHPDRLFGLAQTAVSSVDETIEDVRTAEAMGFAGMMMTGTPQHEDYDHPDYDALYECAVDLEMPLCFHILTSKDHDARSAFKPPRGKSANGFMNIIRGVQDVLGVFLFGGVFERHPQLKIVLAEGDAGWVPHYMYRADHAAERFNHMRHFSKPPSEWVKSNVAFTFQDDATAYHSSLVDSECLMWANDFPHTDSTWPHSQDVLDEQTAGLTDAQRNRICHDNVAATFKLNA